MASLDRQWVKIYLQRNTKRTKHVPISQNVKWDEGCNAKFFVSMKYLDVPPLNYEENSIYITAIPLEHPGISNHQQSVCLTVYLGRKWNQNIKAQHHKPFLMESVTLDSPHKGPVMGKTFPCYAIVMKFIFLKNIYLMETEGFHLAKHDRLAISLVDRMIQSKCQKPTIVSLLANHGPSYYNAMVWIKLSGKENCAVIDWSKIIKKGPKYISTYWGLIKRLAFCRSCPFRI